jgi:hypothetical protein
MNTFLTICRPLLAVAVVFCALVASAKQGGDASSDPRLKAAYRFERAGWVYVHLEGSPSEIGFQHGYLLAPEIQDGFKAIQFLETHDSKHDWSFFRDIAQNVLWPRIEAEYRQELQGITDGLKARGASLDLWDVVALNAKEEIPDYYVPTLERQQKGLPAASLKAPGHCSAFVATGSWTKDHKPVIAHNNWSPFPDGSRFTMIFDIVPAKGYRMLMDGFPGIIVSDDDFTINAAGLAVTETTITGFSLYDPKGIPEFVRARKAMQYASSIDDFVRIMVEGNNGGYANDWLLADNKTGEVARFELGLKIHRVWRSKDGYFVGSNFPSDPELIVKETDFNPKNPASSMNARHKRWDELMAQNKGQIDVALAQQFLADHWDSYENKQQANERTLCGHVEDSPRGVPEWDRGPYYPDGAVTGKAADSTMTKNMSFVARAGHPCGEDFIADKFLVSHTEYEWMKPVLTDMKGKPWAEFKSGDKPGTTP